MSAPIRMGSHWRRLAWLGFAACALAQAGGEDENFMPKGGRTLLVETLGTGAGAAQWREFVAAQKTDAQWAALLSARGRPVAERERATLVAYLSVNMPLPAAALQGQSSEAIVGALPRDGRDLAWNQCQFCHSLFSSHLTQSRDVQGWRNMFLSPFHRELKMTPKEREEFSRYSAINMPMKVEDVPPELRF